MRKIIRKYVEEFSSGDILKYDHNVFPGEK